MTDPKIRTIRSPHTKDRPYFAMSRDTAQDKRLTWEARGVLSYLLSKPDDWATKIKDLMQNCGRDKVYAILDELEHFHYLAQEQTRANGGKFAETERRVSETPFTENPYTGEPYTENPTLTYKREDKIKKKAIARLVSQEKPAIDLDAYFSSEMRVNGKAADETPKAQRKPHPNAPLHDALLTAFGFTPEQVKGKADKPYWMVAEDLKSQDVTHTEVASLHKFVQNKAEVGKWGTWTVNALPKYVPEWRQSLTHPQKTGGMMNDFKVL